VGAEEACYNQDVVLSDLAYTSGVRAAVRTLGLMKFAVILPKPTAMAESIGQALGSRGAGAVQSRGSSLLRTQGKQLMEASPAEQYLAVAGKGSPIESDTSRWFRAGLKEQLPLPGSSAKASEGGMEAALAQIRADAAGGGILPPVSGTAPTMLATIPPPPKVPKF